MTPPDVKALKACAAEVRAFWRRHPGDHVVAQGISKPGAALLDLVDALPADGVVVSRALLERVREALDELLHQCAMVEGTDGRWAAIALAELDGALK